MSIAHVEAAGRNWNRDQSSNSTSPPSARFTPDSGSEDESDLDVGDGDKGYGQAFKLEKSKWSHEEEQRASEPFAEKYRPPGGDLDEHHRPDIVRRAGNSTRDGVVRYSPEEERAVVRKFDRRLVLFMALLYMLSFLDRSNIGNVRPFRSTGRFKGISDV